MGFWRSVIRNVPALLVCGFVLLGQPTEVTSQQKNTGQPKGAAPQAGTPAKDTKPPQKNAAPAAPAGSSEAALAIYADAANFLNGGAYDLSIEQWNRFLKEHPKDPLASKAQHYLGVALMQREKPDYAGAASAFEKALAAKDFDLREEALANRGWCLYTAGRGLDADPKKRDPLLQQALQTYGSLVKEFPQSKHSPQALFFSGEANYAMGQRDNAVKLYSQLLKTAPADSPLRCDALYALGVAEEELQHAAAALDAYGKLLQACASSAMANEVRIRRGDLLLAGNQADGALQEFQAAVAAGGDLADYAQYRYATSLLKLGRGEEAGKAYAELSSKFPNSRYAATAQMAAAQSFYQGQKFDQATPLFKKLLEGSDAPTSIEAAHWLAQIALRQNKAQEAVDVASATLTKHTAAAPYRDALQLDVADALAALNKAKEALDAYALVHEKSQDASLASRALYGAAFTALQARQSEPAIALGKKFMQRFPNDPLIPDAAYVVAEGLLQSGQYEPAATAYGKLLNDVKDHPSRTLWQLRSITASYLGNKFDAAAEAAKKALPEMKTPREKAEANFLLGASELFAGRAQQAVEPLTQALATQENWPQADEARLLLGQAQLKNGAAPAAKATWKTLLEKSPKSRIADQGRYRLGQLLASEQDFAGADQLYQAILETGADPTLKPFALYGKGWCLLQLKKYDESLKALDQTLAEFKDHAVANDARLSRGICLRRLGKAKEAEEQLQAYLKLQPKGADLGYALYELALLELESKRTDAAVAHLRELIEKVPDYPSLDKVYYELAWGLKDGGKEADAAREFEQLVAKFPNSAMAAEASYHVGQQRYSANQWDTAAQAFQNALASTDKELQEKSRYKLGWSQFQAGKYPEAEKTFTEQLKAHPSGVLELDARMMIGECHFKQGKYEPALAAYKEARKVADARPLPNNPDPQEQQVRELVLLHGGQSAAQLEQWNEALQWFGTLREKFPNTRYLAQVFYETGYCHQNLNQPTEALKFFEQVAANYRTEVAARARFMMGEIYFGNRDPAKAIPEFQRVMLGFGAESAPPEIKNWQAKSAFEAGRCAELLIQDTEGDRRVRAIEIAKEFYQYVVSKHPSHELVAKSRERLGVLSK